MKILILRIYPNEMKIDNYNVQEVGLAKALEQKGHTCDIVSYNGKKEDEIKTIYLEKGKTITNYCLKGKNIFKNCYFNKNLYKIIEKYDIIQTEEYDQLQNLQILKKANKPIIIYHGPYYTKFNKYNFKYNLKCKLYDYLFFINNKSYKKVKIITKSKFAEDFLKRKHFKNIQTLGVGLDDKRFEKDEKVNDEFIIDLQNKKKKEDKYILYIGRIQKSRNIKFIIDLLYEVNKKNPNIKLVLVGSGKKEYLNKMMNYAKKLNVYDNIYYNSKVSQDNIANLYKLADIFILPSEYEIFGMVMLEAMYFGVPVITTLNGGSSTLIENEKNGFVCNKNVTEWENKINKLLNDTEYYNTISKNAKEKIEKEFLWEKIADKFINIYLKEIENNNEEQMRC